MGLVKEEKRSVAVSYKSFANDNKLEIMFAPEGQELLFSSLSVNRPGLFLSGYTDYFASSRIQVLGKSEVSYIEALDPHTRTQRICALLSTGVPCVIISRRQRVTKDIIDAAKTYNVPVFRSDKVTAMLINDTANYLNELLAPTESMHGIMLDVYGMGVLITGDSGIGKSETALELVHRGHRLVSDDLVRFKRVRDFVFGEAPEIIKHLMEIRGLGIIDVKAMYGVGAVKMRKRLELIIELQNFDANAQYNRVSNISLSQRLLELDIPKYIIPIMPGRNIAILVEVAVRDFRLRQDGYNTLAEIEKRMDDEQA